MGDSEKDAFSVPASRRSRYYFDIRDGEYVQKDNDGVLLEGIEEARAHAVRALPDIARDDMPEGDHREFAIEVKDEDGRRLFTARLILMIERA